MKRDVAAEIRAITERLASAIEQSLPATKQQAAIDGALKALADHFESVGPTTGKEVAETIRSCIRGTSH